MFYVADKEEFAITVLTVTAWLVVLTQKIAFGGTLQFPFLIVWGAMGILMVMGCAVISIRRAIAFGALAAATITMQIIGHSTDITMTSLLYVILIYAIFMMIVPISREGYLKFLERVGTLGLFFAGLVAFQWAAQLVGLTPFNLEKYIPDSFIFHYYNYIQPINWGSPYMKPNAVFALEASTTSQLLAIFLVIELCILQRPIRVFIFGTMLLATFAGTGIILLLVAAPFMAVYFSRRLIIAMLVAAPVILAGAAALGMLDYFLGRTVEFGLEDSSGYGRFVEPYIFLSRILGESDWNAIFGIGAGNWQNLAAGYSKTIVFNPISKAVLEYGLIIGLSWIAFIHVCMFTSGVPIVVAVALLTQYNLLNGSFIVPYNVYLCFIFAGAFWIAPSYAGATQPLTGSRGLATPSPFRLPA